MSIHGNKWEFVSVTSLEKRFLNTMDDLGMDFYIVGQLENCKNVMDQ